MENGRSGLGPRGGVQETPRLQKSKWKSPPVWVGRAPQCRSRVPGSLEPIGASDPFLDKKTQDKEGGELGPGDWQNWS